MATLTCALGPDCAGTLLSGLIADAHERLDVAVYEMSVYYGALMAGAAHRGVRVRLLLDRHAGANATTARMLRGSGVACRVLGSGGAGEAHWKVLAIDRSTCAVGTGNLLRRDAPRDPGGAVPPGPSDAGAGTREWWAMVEDAPALVARCRRAIAEGWGRARQPPGAWSEQAALPEVPPVGVPTPLLPPLRQALPARRLRLVSGGGAVGATMAAALAAARGRALVTVPYAEVRVPAVARLLRLMDAAASRGVETGLLLGRPPSPADRAALLSAGFPVRVMDPARSTTGHAKGAVIDAAAIVSSANWSAHGLGVNRELGLLIGDAEAAEYFAAAWRHDWLVSTPLTR